MVENQARTEQFQGTAAQRRARHSGERRVRQHQCTAHRHRERPAQLPRTETLQRRTERPSAPHPVGGQRQALRRTERADIALCRPSAAAGLRYRSADALLRLAVAGHHDDERQHQRPRPAYPHPCGGHGAKRGGDSQPDYLLRPGFGQAGARQGCGTRRARV